MKREHEESYQQGVLRHFGFIFWHQCDSCLKDFRREKGWRFLIGPYVGGAGLWRYLCGGCAPTKVDANKYVLRRLNRPSAKPVWPPPPPMKKAQSK